MVRGMTGSERIEAAFSEGGAAEMGVVVPYEGIYERDKWEELTSCPWSYRYSPEIEKQIQWWTDVRRWMAIDWFAIPGFYPRSECGHIRIEDRPDGFYRVNAQTGDAAKIERPRVGDWNAAGAVESYHPASPPDTFDEIDRRIRVPDDGPGPIDLDGRDDLAKALLAGPARGLFPIAHGSSPLWNCYQLWGFEGLMTRIVERRELVAHASERLLRRALAGVRFAKAMGARAIWIEECMTDMIHPNDFRALNVPLIGRFADEIRSAGMKSIYYFCGDPAGKLDHILATGADAIALEEGKKGFEIDIEEVVGAVGGRRVVLGNLDAVGVLQNGTDAELRAEIARQIAAGRRNGSRFVLSVGSPVTPLTAPERVRLYCDLGRESGAIAAS